MPDGFPANLNIDNLPEQLKLPQWSRDAGRPLLDVAIRSPGSKSITNRALLLAALAPGTSTLNEPLIDADDAQRMLKAVEQLGAKIDSSDPNALSITGVGGKWKVPQAGITLDLNNAGTATRFLAASALLSDHPITITGNERMQQRPIAELAQLLETLGCAITYHKNTGCPPLTITPPTPLTGGLKTNTISIEPTQSSQFVSALMLTAVFLEDGLTLTFPDGVTSKSYVQMTLDLLDHLGVDTQASSNLAVARIKPGLSAFTLDIEPDASGATYWWAAGALLNNATIRVQGFDPKTKSLQGDADFPTLLEQMGCTLQSRDNTIAVNGTKNLRSINCDMSDMPDAVMSLASVACFAKGPTIVKGVKTLRVKECDRIAAMKAELGKLGVWVEDNLNGDEDTLAITPPQGKNHSGIDCSPTCEPITFETYDDHRMAMSLSLIALRRPNITINDPKCIAKTYPNFFQHFAKLYN
jgi:3-phosphoshikimate 1-carboxyvinyltransferase